MKMSKSFNNPEYILTIKDDSSIIKLPNVIINIGNAKIVFDKTQIQTHDLLDVYFKLETYLNTFKGIHLK